MKAFWWFKENSIAGMARPGFNAIHWLDLPFREALVMGFLGKFESGAVSLQIFREHIKSYGPKIYKYHHLDQRAGDEAIQIFEKDAGVRQIFDSMNIRSGFLESFDVDGEFIYFSINKKRLYTEIDFLKEQGIRTIVSLTEVHHHKDILAEHFNAHHFAIDDLDAPQRQQAQELAELVKKATFDKEKMAVHCLAGIGRTSTMLMAAHILLGEDREAVKEHLRQRNPRFTFGGVQTDFINQL